MAPPVLILGFGNILLGDDGAGVHFVAQLSRGLAAGCADCIDAGTMSFSLLSYVEEAEALMIVDAAELGSSPGTVQLFEGATMDGFLAGPRRRSVHEVGLIDLLDMARLRGALPERRALLCIQPALIDWSESLSPAVTAALPQADHEARGLLQRWCTA